jgi:hypothetical protein
MPTNVKDMLADANAGVCRSSSAGVTLSPGGVVCAAAGKARSAM